MIKTILLAVDGSTYTDSVLHYGIALAKAFNAKVFVLTVLDIRVFEWVSAVGSDGFVPMVSSGAYQAESQKLLEDKCNLVLKKCDGILTKAGVKFEMERLTGSPANIICDKMNLVDLLIMGRRGEFARWDNKMLGATIDSVSRHCNKPILIALRRYNDIKKILAAYDGSSNSNKALQFAGYFAAGFNVPVSVISVDNDTDLASHHCAEAKKYLDAYEVDISTEVRPGDAENEITKFCKLQDFSLIVIGAYGQSRIREAILGSTTQHILRLSPSAVLLAK